MMTKEGQRRVQALLKEKWGSNVIVDPQPDGSLTAYLTYGQSDTAMLTIASESSPLLCIVAGVDIASEA